jgi:hypothetical protein
MERDHLGDLGVYGRIKAKCMSKKWICEGADGIQMVQNRVQ